MVVRVRKLGVRPGLRGMVGVVPNDDVERQRRRRRLRSEERAEERDGQEGPQADGTHGGGE